MFYLCFHKYYEDAPQFVMGLHLAEKYLAAQCIVWVIYFHDHMSDEIVTQFLQKCTKSTECISLWHHQVKNYKLDHV